MNEKQQAQTYRLRGVQAEDGTPGDLVLEVKPGGNVHADFEPTTGQPTPPPGAPGGPPTPEQLPAQPHPEADPTAPEPEPEPADEPPERL